MNENCFGSGVDSEGRSRNVDGCECRLIYERVRKAEGGIHRARAQQVSAVQPEVVLESGRGVLDGESVPDCAGYSR